jgi:hypothetical protein
MHSCRLAAIYEMGRGGRRRRGLVSAWMGQQIYLDAETVKDRNKAL